MSRIKIRNFGPIKDGSVQSDGWLDIKKVTVFIGNQGSGKSTAAKLISTLTWIEKEIVKKGRFIKETYPSGREFVRALEYHRIQNYVNSDTEIEYIGDRYSFRFSNATFTVGETLERNYSLPKIMYVPAERNFLSVIERPDKLKELPASLYTFLDEYDRARNLFWEGLELPINSVRFSFDKQNKIAHISDQRFNLRLSEASSGFQSTVPLFLTTKYLSDSLTRETDLSVKETSIEEDRKLEKEVIEIFADKTLSHEIKMEALRQLSAKRTPVCFIYIVEEPEQNLFPNSQRDVLFDLLHHNNVQPANKLIFTTHSPYLINALTLSVKAFKVNGKTTANQQTDKLRSIVPLTALVDPSDLVIYQMDEQKGIIHELGNYNGIPSDENFLNEKIDETNDLFSQLQEIEKGWL